MKLFNKDLSPDKVLALEEATAIHNKHFKLHNPEFLEITPEQYLEELIDKQLEGLKTGILQQKEFEQIQKRKLDEARKRVNIIP